MITGRKRGRSEKLPTGTPDARLVSAQQCPRRDADVYATIAMEAGEKRSPFV
jgi:hypothetical protein